MMEEEEEQVLEMMTWQIGRKLLCRIQLMRRPNDMYQCSNDDINNR